MNIKLGHERAVLGGGCFWCLEAVYQRVKGVERVMNGYAGGKTQNPTYEQVLSGESGHAEVVHIEYDPKIISYERLLEIFWHIHDPTTLNRQGNDIGEQYRSIILYTDKEQKQTAEHSLKSLGQSLWEKPIVTEIKELDTFYPAENYHQDYFNKNPEKAYCQAIINPKLVKFQQEFSRLLKA